MLKPSAIALSCVLAVGAALAHEHATGVIAERMTVMKNMGRELKAIGDLLARDGSFDVADIVQHAYVLHENCHRTATLFPPGSIDHHSRALPAIWEKPDVFQKQMQLLHHATEAFVSTAATADKTMLAASLDQIKEICSGCHEKFRLPEN